MWVFITEYYYIIAPITTIILFMIAFGIITGGGAFSWFDGLLDNFIKRLPSIVILTVIFYVFYSSIGFFYKTEISKQEAFEIQKENK